MGQEDQASGKSEELYAENLFALGSSDSSDMVQFILADDYHLLKYLGIGFGIEPAVLRHLYWPHAGFMVVCVTPSGWPYLPFFGDRWILVRPRTRPCIANGTGSRHFGVC
eukprot:Protomagalhaensia_sp_Gyna_25__5072@NODE_576_length_3074_cov_130_557825_g446_i0_p5_GENE_NODE_576_length_3074_cov_130_557825_g446_i0NODE_576_length_3074_cov_130_557825_g446_i0_p5_ORF_typecomplete_len110_score8_93GNAT_acetyltr_2/PF13718_6/0_13DUF4010/PF13194_6/0_26_NODE_576_length_3074_cov_130_557825_g446_i017572086